MEKYKIYFKKSVKKDLNKIPKQDVQRIMKRIAALQENPRPSGARKLTNAEKYRIRQGLYRIIYSIEDSKLIIYIVKIAHRRKAYALI